MQNLSPIGYSSDIEELNGSVDHKIHGREDDSNLVPLDVSPIDSSSPTKKRPREIHDNNNPSKIQQITTAQPMVIIDEHFEFFGIDSEQEDDIMDLMFLEQSKTVLNFPARVAKNGRYCYGEAMKRIICGYWLEISSKIDYVRESNFNFMVFCRAVQMMDRFHSRYDYGNMLLDNENISGSIIQNYGVFCMIIAMKLEGIDTSLRDIVIDDGKRRLTTYHALVDYCCDFPEFCEELGYQKRVYENGKRSWSPDPAMVEADILKKLDYKITYPTVGHFVEVFLGNLELVPGQSRKDLEALAHMLTCLVLSVMDFVGRLPSITATSIVYLCAKHFGIKNISNMLKVSRITKKAQAIVVLKYAAAIQQLYEEFYDRERIKSPKKTQFFAHFMERSPWHNGLMVSKHLSVPLINADDENLLHELGF